MTITMTPESLREYVWNWEKGTVKTLEHWTTRPSTFFSFYGRNMPTTPVGTCDPQLSETWNLTGYGSDAADLSVALRHNSEPILRWLGRKINYAMKAIPWWMGVFGKPPGEDARLYGICGTTQEWIVANNNHGDTDIKRHFNAYGLLKAMVNPKVRELSAEAWSDQEAVDFLGLLLTWIEGRREGVVERPHEYLRYGNDIDTLAGIVTAATALGESGIADRAYLTMASFLYWIFQREETSKILGADGSWWEDHNYGPMIERNGAWYEPFAYGWYPYGLQAWYRGHLCAAAFHAAIVAVQRGDQNLFAHLVWIVSTQTRWLDPTRRNGAPLAETGPEIGAPRFHNSVIQGGFPWMKDSPLLKEGQTNPGSESWRSMKPETTFIRYAWQDVGWCSDGGYWETIYKDGGGTEHPRKHVVAANIYDPGLPGIDTDNGYECVDGLWLRAMIYGDAELLEMARIVLFHHLAYANSSDRTVSLASAVPNGIEPGQNKVGKPSRACHWARQCGFEFRAWDLMAFSSQAMIGWDNVDTAHKIRQTPVQDLEKGIVQ